MITLPEAHELITLIEDDDSEEVNINYTSLDNIDYTITLVNRVFTIFFDDAPQGQWLKEIWNDINAYWLHDLSTPLGA